MNNLQIFKNEQFGEIRTVSIDNEPWFVGKDVAEALGYSNPRDAFSKHVDIEDKRASRFATPSGAQDMTIINESGLYSLVLSSKLPSAKQFKRWVTSEVLPSIRKRGAYMTPVTVDMMIKDPEFGIKLLGELKAEQDKRRALEVENEPKEGEAMTEEEKKLLAVLANPDTQASFIEYLESLGIAPDERVKAIIKAFAPPLDEAEKVEVPNLLGKLSEDNKKLVNSAISILTE